MATEKSFAFSDAPGTGMAALARGASSVPVGDAHPCLEAPQGRALPALLRDRWTIRTTVVAEGATYFMLERNVSGGSGPRQQERRS